jgi:hypothetical protein
VERKGQFKICLSGLSLTGKALLVEVVLFQTKGISHIEGSELLGLTRWNAKLSRVFSLFMTLALGKS